MSLLLLLRSPATVTPPVTPVATINPTPTVEIDFVTPPSASYADIHATVDDVVSFWRFNSASTFLDEKLANNGTILGSPSLVSGPYTYDSNQALSFNGTSDSVYVTSSSTLTTKSAFSIDGWVKVSSLPGGTVDIASKQGAWRMRLLSTGKVTWTLQDDTSTVTVTSNTVLATNTWYHLTGVYDDTTALLYVNGVLDNSAAYSSGMGIESQPVRFAGAMATTAPTWQSVQTASGTSSTITAAKPASTATGDLMIAHLGWITSGAFATITSEPVGWVLLGTIDSGVGFARSRIYAKVATASEPASYSWTTDISTGWVSANSRITGVDSIVPWGRSFTTVDSTGTTTHVTDAHLASTENVMILAAFMERGSPTFTEDSGTERYDLANGVAIAGCTQTQATPSSLAVTGTASTSGQGGTFWVAINGSGVNETACTLDDWSYWNDALTPTQIARNYYSKDSGTGTWTDVSLQARNLNVKPGSRQYELDQMEAGTLALDLKDESRNFDPANTSSAYYPNVVPVRKIRVRTTYESTAYDLFHGYIERWPPDYRAPSYQEISLQAVDGFDGLALADVSGTLDIGRSGAQINRLLDLALWPKDARDIEQGQYIMAAQTLTNAKALASIQEIAASERGIFFIDSSGIATFHDSAHRGSFSRSTVSQVTFTDNHSATGIFYQGLSPSFDKDRIINDWVVTPDSSSFGAAPQEQEDAQSIARYWRRSGSRSTRLISNADAYTQAGNLLTETSLPGQRFDSIVVRPTTAAAYTACLGIQISDRVTVVRGNTTGWDGSIMQKDCFVEAVQITAVPSEPWTFTFSLSPVSLGNYSGAIIRDGPVSYWRMDTLT